MPRFLPRFFLPRFFSFPATFAALAIVSAALLPAPAALAQGLIPAPPPPIAAGTPAPAFVTKTLSGKPLSLAQYKGKVVLLDFWATWCGPCRMATPTLQSLQRTFHKRGFTVVGMSVDDPSALPQVKAFKKNYKVTYPLTVQAAANARAAKAYQVDGIPSQYLIDKKGVVRWSQAGYSPSEKAELSALIKKLLAE